MTIIALLVSLKAGALQLLMAGLTLLPGPIAYSLYGALLKDKPSSKALSPRQRYGRLVLHVLAGLVVAFFIAYSFGQSCPADDGGNCLDDNWKAPTAARNLAVFMRLCLLILGGLAYAYDKHRKRREHAGE